MKVLVAICCFLAVASAGYLGSAVHPAVAYSGTYAGPVVAAAAPVYPGPQHVPVIGPNGVPLEPAANVAARASHAASHAEAIVRNGDLAYAAPLAYAGAVGASIVAAGPVYTGPQHIPVIGPNGVPLEPAANVAARASHAASHAEAIVRNGDLAYAAPLAYTGALGGPIVAAAGPVYAGPQHLPVIGANGVPLEPAANVAARAAHAASHVEAKARNGDLAVAVAAPVAYAAGIAPVVSGVNSAYGTYGHYTYPTLPVIGPNGVPLEPAENVAARAAHAASHVEAKVRNGDLAVLGRKRRGIVHGGVAAYSAALASPYAYGGPIYTGPQHLPVIGSNGVPLEPAANVAARATHAAAHADAIARNGDYAVAVAPAVVAHPGAVAVGVHPAATFPALAVDGQPLETPEVVAAKSAHFVAHAEANARNLAGGVFAPVAYASPYAYAAPYAAGVVTHAGVPLDTPAVAAAKAAHFQAHINEKIAHGILV